MAAEQKQLSVICTLHVGQVAAQFKVGMVEIFHLFFLCTNQSIFRSYFDPRLPFSPDDVQYMIA